MADTGFGLSGKVAVTTGAASGLGRALALAMARQGAASVLVDRDAAGLEALRAALAVEGHDALALVGDVADLAFLERCKAEAIGWRGRVDILLCAAGRALRKTALETTPEDFDALMDVNIRALFLWNQAFGAHMIEAGGGAIVNIASQGGITPLAGRPIYCVSKAAVIHLSRALAVDWAPHKVRVNAIAPGLMDTPFIAGVKAMPGFVDRAVARIPAGRMGLAEDLEGPVLLLASEAGRYMTGQTLVVDGGWTLY